MLAATVVTSLFSIGVFPLMTLSTIRTRLNERSSVAATLIQQDLDTIKAIAADPSQYLTTYIAGNPNTCNPASAPYADDLNAALATPLNAPVQGLDPDYVVTRVNQVSPNGDDVVEVTYSVTFRGDVVLDDVSSAILPSAFFLCP